MEEKKYLDVEEEIKRFNELEIEVDNTLSMLNTVIDMFTGKNEIMKGSSNKLVLLVEQKISLLTRKESIIKNLADMKKNMFTANSKVDNAENGDNDLARALLEYTEQVKKQRKELAEATDAANTLIDDIKNKEEVDKFFKEVS